MGFFHLVDGDDFTEDVVNLMLDQGVVTFATRAARTSALLTAFPTTIPDGFTTWLTDEQVTEQYIGGSFAVVWAKKQRTTLGVAYTPPVTSDASLSTTAFSLLLKAGKRYRIRGELWVPTGTLKLTSGSTVGTITGIWGAGASGASTEDVTSASSVFSVPQGRSSVSGEVTGGASDTTWQVRGYNQTGSATVDVGSWIEVERVG